MIFAANADLKAPGVIDRLEPRPISEPTVSMHEGNRQQDDSNNQKERSRQLQCSFASLR
jgi:hypothetical protein